MKHSIYNSFKKLLLVTTVLFAGHAMAQNATDQKATGSTLDAKQAVSPNAPQKEVKPTADPALRPVASPGTQVTTPADLRKAEATKRNTTINTDKSVEVPAATTTPVIVNNGPVTPVNGTTDRDRAKVAAHKAKTAPVAATQEDIDRDAAKKAKYVAATTPAAPTQADLDRNAAKKAKWEADKNAPAPVADPKADADKKARWDAQNAPKTVPVTQADLDKKARWEAGKKKTVTPAPAKNTTNDKK